jgi:hypothetical protein
MKRNITLSLVMAAAIALNSIPAQSQSLPEPKVKLTSIVNNLTYQDSKFISYTVEFERINDAAYSDRIRIWLCPESSWTGSLCSAGFIAIDATPGATATSAILNSAEIELTAGKYLVTSVSFRNAAVVAGYTLSYLRSGMVTLGGSIINLPWVNIIEGDFSVPEPTINLEPEIEPDLASDTTPSESTENLSTVANESTNTNSEESIFEPTHAESTETSPTQTEPPAPEIVIGDGSEPAVSIESENNSTENSTHSPSLTENTSANIEEANTINDLSKVDYPDVTSDGEVNGTSVQPLLEVASPQIVTPINPNEEIGSLNTLPLESTDNKSEPPQSVSNILDPITEITEITEISSRQAIARRIDVLRSGAAGGSVTKVIGPAKLELRIEAGVGKLGLFGSSLSSTLRVKLGSKEIAYLDLASKPKHVIKWYALISTNLKLILTGSDDSELIIDSLRINRKLNPTPYFILH